MVGVREREGKSEEEIFPTDYLSPYQLGHIIIPFSFLTINMQYLFISTVCEKGCTGVQIDKSTSKTLRYTRGPFL